MVWSQAELDALAAHHCAVIEDLDIQADDFETLEGLESIKSAKGPVNVSGGALRSLEGLSGLKLVGGAFYISDAPHLESLHGLEQLTTVAGTFGIRETGMKTLEGLASLRQGRLSLTSNDALTSFVGLSQTFGDVESSISMQGAPALESLEGLESIKTIDSLTFEDTALTSLSPLQDWKAGTVKVGVLFNGNAALRQCEIDHFVEAQGLTSGCGSCEGNSSDACE